MGGNRWKCSKNTSNRAYDIGYLGQDNWGVLRFTNGPIEGYDEH